MADITKNLYAKIEKFAYSNGFSTQTIYTSLLDYMAGFLDWKGHKVDGWTYTQEQNQQFWQMTLEAFKAISEGMQQRGWYDLFGDLFMQHIGDKKNLGQCFTPEAVADVCSMSMLKEGPIGAPLMQCGTFGTKHVLNDPACGSGRLMLSAAYFFQKKYEQFPYVICEDIDSTCCKQTAINLALHGFYGEVVCHNTIKEPDSLRFGYIVNEGLFPSRDGLPTLRYSTDPTRFVCIRFWNARRHNQTKNSVS